MLIWNNPLPQANKNNNHAGLGGIVKKIILSTLFSVLIITNISCKHSGPSGSHGDDPTSPQTERLRIANNCSYTIWIQQQNMSDSTPTVVKLESGQHYDYVIPDEGLASTRLWPKSGCDASGENCTVGQSSDPCTNCPPPVDSKIEATWGCTLTDQSQCAYTPQGDQITTTSWNTSAVDGYTLAYTTSVSGNTLEGDSCTASDCSSLSLDNCPTAENLSQGQTQTHSEYSSVDLKVMNDDGTVIGCYSPCKALNYPTYGGKGLDEDSDAAVMYCCPTPPISSAECNAGPIVDTSYVSEVHTACNNSVYTFAYDDATGLRTCSADTKIKMTFCP